jgi:hypothetical protein
MPQRDDAYSSRRGGAELFARGGLRPHTSEERLQGTLGSLQSFFARTAAIGTPAREQEPLMELAQEGQMRKERALGAPMREQQEDMLRQAAMARAQIEAEEREQKAAELESRRRENIAQTYARVAPDLGPIEGDASQGPPSLEEMPQGALAEFFRTGDASPIARFIRPGRGEQEKQRGELQKGFALEGKRQEGAIGLERERQRGDMATERLREAGKDRRDKGEGKKLTISEARAVVADLVEPFDGNPAEQYRELKEWADKDRDVDQEVFDYVQSKLRTYKRLANDAKTPE